MNRQGFTLIELLITIAIIGILAGVAVTAYVGSTLKASRSEAYSNLKSIWLLEEEFFSLNGRYTDDLGVAGDTFAIRDANVRDIQTTVPNPDALPGFRPGNAAEFSYMIEADTDLAGTNPTPGPCFRATATGLVGTRVGPPDPADSFMIDCNNDRNF
jgi:prepilin-type N-terminal cleavage/methylation domain-containing protein